MVRTAVTAAHLLKLHTHIAKISDPKPDRTGGSPPTPPVAAAASTSHLIGRCRYCSFRDGRL